MGSQCARSYTYSANKFAGDRKFSRKREKQFIDALQKAFGIDEDTAMRIVGVLLIKSRA
jgi:hypothetical protein